MVKKNRNAEVCVFGGRPLLDLCDLEAADVVAVFLCRSAGWRDPCGLLPSRASGFLH